MQNIGRKTQPRHHPKSPAAPRTSSSKKFVRFMLKSTMASLATLALVLQFRRGPWMVNAAWESVASLSLLFPPPTSTPCVIYEASNMLQ